MGTYSRYRCQLSCLRVVHGPFEEAEGYVYRDEASAVSGLVTAAGGAASGGRCYLHTLTFAEPEPDVKEAMKRLNSFSVWLRRKKKKCVRVVQRGDENGRVHFHFVSGDRWEVREMRPALLRYGFGRYNVRERPASVAIYAARYVGRKSKYPLPKGTRTWACIGFKGVKVADLDVKKRTCVLVANQPLNNLPWVDWEIDGHNCPVLVARTDFPPVRTLANTQMNEIKPVQQKEIIAETVRGSVVAVGEYRASDIRTLEVSDKKNPAAPRIRRVVVEHYVELGGRAVPVMEWLPVGADEKAFKAPASCGESVLVLVERMEASFGRDRKITGRIKSLITLNLG